MASLAIAATSFQCYLSFAFIGNKVVSELKWRYLKAILTKDMEWFDHQNVNKLPSEVFTNLSETEAALGAELGFVITAATCCVCGIAFSFYCSVVLGALYIIVVPFVVAAGMAQNVVIMKINKKNDESYIQGGADAEQALSSIKVVKAYGQESHELQKFKKHIGANEKEVKRGSYLYGLTQGIMQS
jgi:ABC-type multidrug transport system fused ATPase/permease subunit